MGYYFKKKRRCRRSTSPYSEAYKEERRRELYELLANEEDDFVKFGLIDAYYASINP